MNEPRAAARCLLFVEDEQALLHAFSRAFTRAGFEILQANGVAAALGVWATHRERIALILSDVQMPGLPVEDLIARARADHPAIPIVLMSGDVPGSEERFRTLVSGVNGFIPKPVPLETILREIERHLEPRQDG